MYISNVHVHCLQYKLENEFPSLSLSLSLSVSLLQSLPEPHPLTVTEHVHSAIAAALSGAQQLLAGHSQRLQYLEALGENFPLGEVALWRQLPLGK